MIPDCYEPYFQEEQMQKKLDDLADMLPACTLCHRRLYPGEKFHTARYQIVCIGCKEELEDNEDIVEIY